MSNVVDEDIDIIESILYTYNNQLFSLKNMEFLSEEKKSVVFVGPNGCGKTTLLRDLIHATGENKIGYYQADRLLVINDTYSPERDIDVFTQKYKNTDQKASDINDVNQSIHISNQLTQVVSLFEKKRAQELELVAKGSMLLEECSTEKVLDIWNKLIKERELYSFGTVSIRPLGGDPYPIKYMSSGEKSIFYFLASILLKEKKEYYFIDEPENNLNTSVVSLLWDEIESFYPDSIFVYLTHDSDFVASRKNSKVFWIESYNGNKWDYKPLPENDDLSQDMVIKLVGNRKPVLFCESHDEYKYDDMLFKLLFPEFKIVPAGGCEAVMSKSKAYNMVGLPQRAYGIIDCDYRSKVFLEGQKKSNIYYFPFFEIENFLLCEDIVRGVIGEYSRAPEDAFENLKKHLKQELVNCKEQWITRKIGFKLKETFFNKRINALDSTETLKKEYYQFQKEIDIDDLYIQYEAEYNDMLQIDDYNNFLAYYDNKGIFTKFAADLKLQDKKPYKEVVFEYLTNNEESVKALRETYFPEIVS